MISTVDEHAVKELVDLVLEGSTEAGTFLVSLCGARLAKYVNLIAPDLSERQRENICEVAVERAVRGIDKYRPVQGSFDSWLRGYARYVVREERRRAWQEVSTDPAELPEVSPPPEETKTQTNPLADLLHSALLTLSETDQMIIRLRDYEDLPYSEIAELLNVQEPATRQRHARALKRLREVLVHQPEFQDILGESKQ
jgi:RNA polymerase sigma factor (sigma-70 family)